MSEMTIHEEIAKGNDHPEKKPYRINLKLYAEYKDFLTEEAWRQRKSVTALLNEIIGEYRDGKRRK